MNRRTPVSFIRESRSTDTRDSAGGLLDIRCEALAAGSHCVGIGIGSEVLALFILSITPLVHFFFGSGVATCSSELCGCLLLHPLLERIEPANANLWKA